MHEENTLMKLLYSFFLGILLALFVGFGVSTFYESPTAPEYPAELQNSKELTEEQRIIERDFESEQDTYFEEELQPYNRNVSIITLAAAIIFLVVSMLFGGHLKVISDGVMMGGVFTLLYSIGRGIASNDTKYMFVAVSIGLLVVLFLGYRRFTQKETSTKNSD